MAGDIRDSLVEEAARLLAAARERDVPLRLLGGVAIQIMLGERMDERFQRESADLDFLTTKRSGRAVEELLASAGWEPERQFNALNGARRLLFEDAPSGHKIDVFVESFEMCHMLPLAERMSVREDTLPAAELAMTKLQVVSLNTKDRNDLYALLHALEVADHDDDAINALRISELTSGDWGLHHTFELNFARLRDGLAEVGLSEPEQAAVRARIDALHEAIEQAPKSRGWRMRARIGERKRWYEEPEEIER
ncbi:MAG TPA: nucleotidyltransferase family protein [Solirubrobacteraceae bacterium]|jgi:hypothetical protein|nr:nucleotidyltransferase family protein [Solirubrobacteraceae bacterium]